MLRKILNISLHGFKLVVPLISSAKFVHMILEQQIKLPRLKRIKLCY